MNGRNKKEKGRTLIALIVTIVVLIILATISMFAVFGENGIIVKAQEAKRMHEEGKSTEENRLDDYTKYIGNYIKKDDTGSDNIVDGGGSDEDEEEPEWKKLTPAERIEKIENLDAKLELFNVDVLDTFCDANIAGFMEDKNHYRILDDDGNFVYRYTKSTTTVEAKCECGKVKEIYNKAKEMGLVRTYNEVESNMDKDKFFTSIVTATVKEPSLVVFDFSCLNDEQRPGGVIPMAYALNHEITPNLKEWFDSGMPSLKKGGSDYDYGDFERISAWVNSDYAKNGFIMMSVHPTMYPDIPIEQLGQTTHAKIEVLSQTNFRKAMKALNLDLSAYEGKCTHPTK